MGRLHPHDPAQAGRNPDGATGVGADGPVTQVEGHRYRGSSGRAAGYAAVVHGIASHTVVDVVIGDAEGVFVHVRLADHLTAGLLDGVDDRRVGGRRFGW